VNALLQSDCKGNVPWRGRCPRGAWTDEIPAHLSPFTRRRRVQPNRAWELVALVSPISCPPTMVIPASGPESVDLGATTRACAGRTADCVSDVDEG